MSKPEMFFGTAKKFAVNFLAVYYDAMLKDPKASNAFYAATAIVKRNNVASSVAKAAEGLVRGTVTVETVDATESNDTITIKATATAAGKPFTQSFVIKSGLGAAWRITSDVLDVAAEPAAPKQLWADFTPPLYASDANGDDMEDLTLAPAATAPAAAPVAAAPVAAAPVAAAVVTPKAPTPKAVTPKAVTPKAVTPAAAPAKAPAAPEPIAEVAAAVETKPVEVAAAPAPAAPAAPAKPFSWAAAIGGNAAPAPVAPAVTVAAKVAEPVVEKKAPETKKADAKKADAKKPEAAAKPAAAAPVAEAPKVEAAAPVVEEKKVEAAPAPAAAPAAPAPKPSSWAALVSTGAPAAAVVGAAPKVVAAAAKVDKPKAAEKVAATPAPAAVAAAATAAPAAAAAAAPAPRAPRAPAAPQHYHLYLRNLPPTATQESVYELLAAHVPVKKTPMKLEFNSDSTRRFGFVLLDAPQEEVAKHISGLRKHTLKMKDEKTGVESTIQAEAVREKAGFGK